MPWSRTYLRPPGALSEKQLKARCVSCGQCAAVCNFRAVEMTPDGLFGPETPKIYARKNPCRLCMRCSDICPTDALHKVEQDNARMGMAVIDAQRCVDYQERSNIICWTCFNICPMRGRAILLKHGYSPVITDQCQGCGVCAFVCLVSAITIVPERMR
jgi:ferredoxin-type protein NapF